MSPIPIITGIGLITPLGRTAAENWDALLSGRYITDHSKIPLETCETIPRVSQLAIRAAREALGSKANWSNDQETALVVGTSKGPVEDWLKPPSRLSDLKGPVDFGLAGLATGLAHNLGLIGPRLTVSAACASGLHALIRGTMLIGSGEARRVLVVASEASIHPLFLASFARLGVLPAAGAGCRPFDRERDGFLMSEAAAAVCLEAADGAGEFVAIERFALGADASHLTSSDPDAIALGRILNCLVADRPVDLIHAQGTGTVMNDAVELATIERVFRNGPGQSSLYSHKGALGHSLGAAGLVSVVINVMCHQKGIVPPNVRTTRPIPMENVILKQSCTMRQVRRSVAIAAGFGGPIAGISLVNRT